MNDHFAKRILAYMEAGKRDAAFCELRLELSVNPDNACEVTPSGAGHLVSEMMVSDEKTNPAGQAGART
jgi:hypothetical protein